MRTVLILAGAVAALATTARAEDEATRDANRQDVRCALAMTVMMKDESVRASAAIGLYYFAGRIEARDPSLDLAVAMKREASRIQNSEWRGEMQRCGAALQAKTKSFEDIKAAFGQRGVGR